MNQSTDEKRGLSHNDIFPHLRLLSLSHRVVDCELKSVPTLFDQIIILSPPLAPSDDDWTDRFFSRSPFDYQNVVLWSTFSSMH